MNTAFSDMAVDILNEFSVDAVYTDDQANTTPCRVLLNLNTEVVGDNFGTIAVVKTLEYLTSTGIDAHRGDQFAVNGQTYKVESILSQDDIWVKVVVK